MGLFDRDVFKPHCYSMTTNVELFEVLMVSIVQEGLWTLSAE